MGCVGHVATVAAGKTTHTLVVCLVVGVGQWAIIVARAVEEVATAIRVVASFADCRVAFASGTWRLTGNTDTGHGGRAGWAIFDTGVLMEVLEKLVLRAARTEGLCSKTSEARRITSVAVALTGLEKSALEDSSVARIQTNFGILKSVGVGSSARQALLRVANLSVVVAAITALIAGSAHLVRRTVGRESELALSQALASLAGVSVGHQVVKIDVLRVVPASGAAEPIALLA